MRKMFSKNQIVNLIEEQDLKPKTIEQREPSYEAELTINTENFTLNNQAYKKCVLLSNDLHIVIAASSIKAAQNLSENAVLASFSLPKEIADKIYTVSDFSDVVTSTIMNGSPSFSWNGNKLSFILKKLNDTDFTIITQGTYTANEVIYNATLRLELVII